jgi:hypothetical protein
MITEGKKGEVLMKNIVIIAVVIATIFIISCGGSPTNPADKVCNSVVIINDPVFRSRVIKSLGTDKYGAICQSDADNVTTLDISGLGTLNDPAVTSLAGIGQFKNLKVLIASFNSISDLTPLIALPGLEQIVLDHNPITDLSALTATARTALTRLVLGVNKISDITPLSSLTSLQVLDLASNQIVDISPLAGLVNLTELTLDANKISDITAVAGKPALTQLYLNNNNITDISAVGGLANLAVICLNGNKLITNIGPLTGLINLKDIELKQTGVAGLAPLIANTGLGSGCDLEVCDTALIYAPDVNGIMRNAEVEALRSRWVMVWAITAHHNPIMDLPGTYEYSCTGVSGVAGVTYLP